MKRIDPGVAYLRFAVLKDDSVVGPLFDQLRYIFKLRKYFDPKQSRELQDFEQIARLGVWKALKSFDSTRGPLIPWIIRVVKSELAAEVKRINRELNPVYSFDWRKDGDSDSSTDHLEPQIDYNLSYKPIDPTMVNRLYLEYITRVKSILRKSGNVRLLEIFNIKMLFPGKKNREIAKWLGVSVAIISQCVGTIELTLKMVSRDHAESYRERGI